MNFLDVFRLNNAIQRSCEAYYGNQPGVTMNINTCTGERVAAAASARVGILVGLALGVGATLLWRRK